MLCIDLPLSNLIEAEEVFVRAICYPNTICFSPGIHLINEENHIIIYRKDNWKKSRNKIRYIKIKEFLSENDLVINCVIDYPTNIIMRRKIFINELDLKNLWKKENILYNRLSKYNLYK